MADRPVPPAIHALRLMSALKRPDVALQLARFGMVGLVLSLVTGLTYTIAAIGLGIAPLLANLAAYAAAALIGFFLHGSVTFKGYGSRDRPAVRAFWFFAASTVSLCMNSLFVFVITDLMRLSAWYPLIPMIFVTPIASFAVQRLLVYK